MALPKRPSAPARPQRDEEEDELDRALGLAPPAAHPAVEPPLTPELPSLPHLPEVTAPRLPEVADPLPEATALPSLPSLPTESGEVDETAAATVEEIAPEASSGEEESPEDAIDWESFFTEITEEPEGTPGEPTPIPPLSSESTWDDEDFGFEDAEAETPPTSSQAPAPGLSPLPNESTEAGWDDELSSEVHDDDEDEDDDEESFGWGDLPEEEEDLSSYSAFGSPPGEMEEQPPEEEAPAEEEPEAEEVAPLDEEESAAPEETSQDEEPRPKKRGKSKQAPKGDKQLSPLAALLLPVKKLYMFITNGLFGFVKGLLQLLARIPVIGLPFRIALRFVRVIEFFARSLPLLFVVAALLLVNYFAVPSSSSVELPDSGGATFSAFTYDGGAQEAVGTVTNTGEIIAEVTPVVRVWTLQPELNPVSWVIPKVTQECVGETVSVESGAELEVRVTCAPGPGLAPRASGELRG